jgi:hypothetical protein
MRLDYEYEADGSAEVNTNVFEVGNSNNAVDMFQNVSGSGSESEVFTFDQAEGESVTWAVTALIEENGEFDQHQFDVTIGPDGAGSTPSSVPVSRIGGTGGGGGNGGGGGQTPAPGGQVAFGLSRTELALLGLAAGSVGVAYVRTQ